MISSKRHAKIKEALRATGVASVRELADRLQVSQSTIRRDLTLLDRDGELLRTYGGAALPLRGAAENAADEEPFDVSASHDRVMLGGVLRRNYQSLVGSLTERALSQVSADLLFLSCTGVRAGGHVVDDMAVEEPIKHAMIEAADRLVLLASEAKFPGTGSLRLCSLSDIDVLVTTGGADPRTLQLCRQAGGQVLVA
ncbi:DeoR/GlpR family DNA-binding transcription regulator [Streptomyces sp. NPDC005263]|uniref:DeoR/GlpR family DNA-binding transcription regulator n=1 Tax=Streptomyces sp. NPDC005263 TaxID=3364711 RepID=UPI003687BB34